MAPHLFSCFGRSGSPGSKSVNKSTADLTTEEQRSCGPVLVELFSSQGCTTSPDAELLLSRLGKGDLSADAVPVVSLAYHVDYWDYMGWKDPVGDTRWTVRQKVYVEALKLDTIFTPQFVVQGRAECVGTDSEALISCIASAPRFPVPAFRVTFQRPTRDSLQVSLTGCLKSKVNGSANLMVALYECGLVTDCSGGPNKGRVLANDYIVRSLEKLCSLNDTSPKKTISGTLNFSLWEGFNPAKCGIAMFVQNSSHQIFGSHTFQLPNNL